jgi:hypothetical protein
MNHVSVDRCYQCDTAFASEDKALEVAEVGVGAIAAPASTADGRAIASAPLHDNPQLGPPDRIPVALSDRMEASTERVAVPGEEPQPLMPFADAAPSEDVDDEDDWIDPRRVRAARQISRARRRQRLTQAALAGISLFVIAGAGYYAYDTGMVPRVTQMARAFAAADDGTTDAPPARVDARPPVPPSPTVTQADRGAAGTDNAATSAPLTAGAATPATDTRTASTPTAPSTSPPAAPALEATATPPPASLSSAASQASSDVPTSSTKARTSEPTRRAARETSPRSSRSAAPAVDRDALATQRLIERDLAGFLPPEPQQRGPR